MTSIAILVPVCSRNQQYKSSMDIPIIKYLLPTFINTKEDKYTYTFFIGFDHDDLFYIQNQEVLKRITPNLYSLTNCQHAPAFAWNKLSEIAFKDKTKYDYFFQIGDDVQLLTKKWTSHFIEKLNKHDNIGIVGPCNDRNYYGRINSGKKFVIENSFVSRKHLEIFGSFFNPTIKNWFCDDWITRIYDPFFCEIQLEFKCINSVMDRYSIIPTITGFDKLVEDGQNKIYEFLKK
jgi:hypothetical protein